MSMLDKVVSGKKPVGQRIVIAGVEKVGKTTLACDAPNSLLVPLEMGYASIVTPRLPGVIQSWAEVDTLCNELISKAQAGQIAPGSTIVWDSLTALERLAHDETLRLDPSGAKALGKAHSMETSHGGYGKAYPIANGLFQIWASKMDQLAFYGGVNIICTCHVFAAHVVDPAHGEYETWDLLLHSPKNQKNYGKREFITQWADLVGFLHEPMFVMKNEGEKTSRGVSSNQGRFLAVDRSPSWVAGNRYGLHNSIPIPHDPLASPPVHGWNYLADAIFKASGIDVYNRG